MKKIKLFVSYASEDSSFVEPLAEALRCEANLEVWFDKFVLTLGDSLLRKISEGLAACDFGVVVMSPHFFNKEWPQHELDGFFALETANRKVILPIWKDIDREGITRYSPIMANRLAVKASEGIPKIVSSIQFAVSVGNRTSELTAKESVLSRFKSLHDGLAALDVSDKLMVTQDGMHKVNVSADRILKAAEKRMEALGKQSTAFAVETRASGDHLSVEVVRLRIKFNLTKRDFFTNGVARSYLHFVVFRPEAHGGGQRYHEVEYRPHFADADTVLWERKEAEAMNPAGVVDEIVNVFVEKLELEKRKIERDHRRAKGL